MSEPLHFGGYLRDYVLPDKNVYVAAVNDILHDYEVKVNGKLINGRSISQVIYELRNDHHLQVPGLYSDVERMLKALGFTIVHGLAGKATRGGWRYCVSAQCVIRSTLTHNQKKEEEPCLL